MSRFPAIMLLAAASSLSAQQLVTLDGTSGAMTTSANYSTNASGGLKFSLGFNLEYLVVGGGGGGGGSLNGAGGGGGAGGYITGSAFVSAISHDVTVGAGGSGGAGGVYNQWGFLQSFSGLGANGGNSSFSSWTALGGGGGGNSYSTNAGNAGGSGGGGGSSISGNTRVGGLGTSGQGYSGGSNSGAHNATGIAALGGSGGGGAAGAGGSLAAFGSTTGASGGAGITSSFDGTSREYSKGGAGGSVTKAATGASASVYGGGGEGGSVNYVNMSSFGGGSGANGVVIVRYLGSAAGTGGSISTSAVPGYTVHTFGTAGSSALNLSSLDLGARLGTTLSGVISGSNGLTFDGPGRLTLNAANTYSGATIVNGGTLALGASGSISDSSTVNLASGSTLDVSAKSGFTLASGQTLSGGGTVVGDTVIAGAHTPGFSPGLQTFSNNLTYADGSDITWELAANSTSGRGTSFDGIDVQGNLTFQGTVALNLSFSYVPGTVDWTSAFWDTAVEGIAGWKIFGVTGTVNGFANLQIANADWLDANGASFATIRPNGSFSLYQGADGIYLNYTPVPEPSTYGLILGALALAGTAVRRRKTSK